MVSNPWGVPPKIIHFNRIFHERNLSCWASPNRNPKWNDFFLRPGTESHQGVQRAEIHTEDLDSSIGRAWSFFWDWWLCQVGTCWEHRCPFPLCWLPSGKHTKSYWTWPFIVESESHHPYDWFDPPKKINGFPMTGGHHVLVSNMNCIFHNIWDNPSHWLIFFKMVIAPPTRMASRSWEMLGT